MPEGRIPQELAGTTAAIFAHTDLFHQGGIAMKDRPDVIRSVFGLLATLLIPCLLTAQAQTPQSPQQILLKDYRPVPIYKIPVSTVSKARFPAPPKAGARAVGG